MNHLCLFSGIGGFIIAAQRAGFTTVQAVEIDAFCRAVLAKNFPGLSLHDDIRTYSATHLLGIVGLLTGGFPCQDISIAGKGAGIEGERSGLWREMFRILCECRPAFVLIENVPALKSRGADRVLSDLEGADYTAGAFVVGADDIGATHRRKRVWIVAYTRHDDNASAVRGGSIGAQPLSGRPGEEVAATDAGMPARSGSKFLAHADEAGRGEHSGAVSGREFLPSSQHGSETMAYSQSAELSRASDARRRRAGFTDSSGDALAYCHDAESVRGEGAVQPGRGTPDTGSLPRFPPARNDFRGWAAVASVDASLLPCVEREVRPVVDGIPLRLVQRRRNAQLKALGNAIVPQVAEIFCQWIAMQLRTQGKP